jgi:hypothetical protein
MTHSTHEVREALRVARVTGATTYIGYPCAACDGTLKYTKNQCCVPCTAKRTQRWHEKQRKRKAELRKQGIYPQSHSGFRMQYESMGAAYKQTLDARYMFPGKGTGKVSMLNRKAWLRGYFKPTEAELTEANAMIDSVQAQLARQKNSWFGVWMMNHFPGYTKPECEAAREAVLGNGIPPGFEERIMPVLELWRKKTSPRTKHGSPGANPNDDLV